jgi:hypothetical protein
MIYTLPLSLVHARCVCNEWHPSRLEGVMGSTPSGGPSSPLERTCNSITINYEGRGQKYQDYRVPSAYNAL